MGNRDITIDWEKNFNEEFATIDSFNKTYALTAKTDAFILTWVKAEKQVRKIFTHLIYQIFPKSDVIKELIYSYDDMELTHFIRLFNAFHKKSFFEVVGDEYLNFLGKDITSGERERIRKFRNKILHGQLTDENLNGSQLEKETFIICNWIKCVAEKMSAEFGYDGLGRNSLTKSNNKDIQTQIKDDIQINTKKQLKTFINGNKNKNQDKDEIVSGRKLTSAE